MVGNNTLHEMCEAAVAARRVVRELGKKAPAVKITYTCKTLDEFCLLRSVIEREAMMNRYDVKTGMPARVRLDIAEYEFTVMGADFRIEFKEYRRSILWGNPGEAMKEPQKWAR